MLMPCFKPEEGFAEGVIIGRLFTGYGELELEACSCLIGQQNGDFDGPIRSVFSRKKSAEQRVKDLKKALRPKYVDAGLDALMSEIFGDLNFCRSIRNQYAHCVWGWDSPKQKLFFVDLEALADQPADKRITKLMGDPRWIDVKLLSRQEAFFTYVKGSLIHLGTAYTAWLGSKNVPYIFPRPQKVVRPPKHG